MPQYTFTFKKDDIFVEFTTTDKETVERQFQVWVASADEYAKQGAGKSEKGNKIKVSSEELAVNNDFVAPQQDLTNQSSQNSTPQSSLLTPHSSVEKPEIIDKASTLLKTINTIQETENREQEAEGLISPKENPNAEFDKVLAQSIENPSFEPSKTQDKLFLNLVNSKHTKDKFHYLIITAYYLSEFEKLQRFSLKQINSKMMQNLSEVIDHSTLQEAINQGFIDIVPDLTGISDVAEYKLTLAGEEFFANRI